MKPTYFKAVQILTDNKALYGPTNGEIEKIVFPEGFIPPQDADIKTKLAELQAEYDAKQYQRDRNYPDIGEQLDMLYHDMTSGKNDKTGEWYKAISKVKTDNPKSS